MRYGRTIRESMYAPWADHYLDYSKLKAMLREDEEDDKAWTEEDENKFSEELLTVQLDKVSDFHRKQLASLESRADADFEKLKDLVPSKDKPRSDITTARLTEFKGELDDLTNELKELKKFSSVNYTGFLKIVKKHDRKRGDRYKVRPLIRMSLTDRRLNSEETYLSMLQKLSNMYEIINSHLEEGDQLQPPDLEEGGEVQNGDRYTAHKFWVHEDNLLEVKTLILRRLPALVYSNQTAKDPVDGTEDPSITSLYFDNPEFDLYTSKLERQGDASSLRLRWSGPLSSQPEIFLERKTIYESGVSEEKRISIKDKYVKSFIDGQYKMEKTISKLERQGLQAEQIESYKSTADQISEFITSSKLEPVLRANYNRQAFQKQGDGRVRISIDSQVAFIRCDTLDLDRPCRDPSEWHRLDIDENEMTYPFKNINQSEISRFPYSILEVKVREEGGRKKPSWVEDLMNSHLLHPAPKFSKFVHGVASLFIDHISNTPFWLADVETDIRRDPRQAFEAAETLRAQRAENDQMVDSFLGEQAKSFKPKSYLSERAQASPVGTSYVSDRAAIDSHASKKPAKQTDGGASSADGANGSKSDGHRSYGTTLSSILPSFSLRKQPRVVLPDGVSEPTEWLKNAGELKIEPKIWLANERTVAKWMHIGLLLGAWGLAFMNAAGNSKLVEGMGYAFIVISGFTFWWGMYMWEKRKAMIKERSGKDFDNWIGPIVVCVALMVALILNFVLAVLRARQLWENSNGTTTSIGNGTQVAVDEL